ncbi:ABC transporter permease [Poritiphilus flavus]|uniref:FtsX-like permease family protein n=1 Tax=Poritiphilus flavus TaxID=2697053 RepID=A0A6L9EB03_9FLAO|nr:ABC transporter permease [Poritiphilus flavus]NAS11619.1 FtsX-like permease family protein [Poritiphilus flavus]
MIKNYLKIAWRNLLKNKGYSAINIGGLALGMAVVILIGLWVADELSFNTYHKNYDRIGQIYERAEDPDSGGLVEGNSMMYVTGTVLKENFQDYFKHILRAYWVMDFSVRYQDETLTQTGEFIDSGALEMFSLEMIKGTYSSMDERNAIVISNSAAKAIFGKEDPIGKSVRINNEMNGVVKGIYKDLPKNTRFENVDFFANWNLLEDNSPWIDDIRDVWDDYSFNLYVELKPQVDPESAQLALSRFFRDYAPESFARLEKYKPELFMYPMSKWHLYNDFEQSYPTKGRISFVWLFAGIGLFVLCLACINFMNLSTARSEKRAKEVGIRKTLGSEKKLLVYQFLGESLLVATMSFVLALALVSLALPWFNNLADKAMHLPLTEPGFWLVCLLITVTTGLLAGSYPALFLSSFRPIKVLKGTFKAGNSASLPRKVLVVFQFAVSIVLTIGTVIVFGQIQHTKNRPMGYDSQNLISIEMNNPEYTGKYNLLRNELKKTGLVLEMSQSSSPLTGIYSNSGGFDWEGKDPDRDTHFGILRVSHDHGNAIGWEFAEGRDFSRDLASDSTAIIINETAVTYMGLEDPVGKYVTRPNTPPLKIIGIVKDLVMESPYQPVRQSVFFLSYEDVNYINIKLNTNGKTSAAISRIREVFAKVVPSANFDYRFVDLEYNKKFQSEQRLGSLAGVFTALAIFISCLGLFGLASFVSEQRTKEIGVRKVLGATVYNLWSMLSKDFVTLVLISCLIAVPMAFYFMNRWLEGYEYRMEISWWIFGLAVAGAMTITILTVSFQALKAASANPIKSLRTE